MRLTIIFILTTLSSAYSFEYDFDYNLYREVPTEWTNYQNPKSYCGFLEYNKQADQFTLVAPGVATRNATYIPGNISVKYGEELKDELLAMADNWVCTDELKVRDSLLGVLREIHIEDQSKLYQVEKKLTSVEKAYEFLSSRSKMNCRDIEYTINFRPNYPSVRSMEIDGFLKEYPIARLEIILERASGDRRKYVISNEVNFLKSFSAPYISGVIFEKFENVGGAYLEFEEIKSTISGDVRGSRVKFVFDEEGRIIDYVEKVNMHISESFDNSHIWAPLYQFEMAAGGDSCVFQNVKSLASKYLTKRSD